MRDSNYKSVGNNRAAVTITTSLYDRRALDVTSDKPLVNSLNHLTYLVSSLAKVRETLSVDGGIERLIEILHECHNSTFNLNDNIFNSERKILTAWKWTLAFQCLVLIGTRGTETIRQRVVKAGMLPIIATILDNYLTLHERTFIQANRKFPDQSSGFQNQQQAYENDMQSNYNHNQGNSQPPSQVPDTTAHEPIGAVPSPHPPQFQPQPQPQQANFDNINIQNGINDNTPANPQENNNRDNLNFLTQFETFQNNFPMDASTTAAAAIAASSMSNATNPGTPFFNNLRASSLTTEDYENLSVEQLFKLIRVGDSFNGNSNNDSGLEAAGMSFSSGSSNNDIRRRYLVLLIIKKLKEEKESDSLDTRFSNDTDYDMDNNLQFLSDMYLQDDKSTHLSNLAFSKVAPRNFTETGVVIPRDDDIVWSLQLLAYISKYPYLKDVLQNTHLVIDMSVRDKQLKLFIEKQFKSKLKKNLAIKQRPTIKPKSRKSKLVNFKLESFNQLDGTSTSQSREMSGDADDNDKSTGANANSHNEENIRLENGNSNVNENEESGNGPTRLGFSASASNSPQMLSGINSLQDDNFILDQDKLELCAEDDTNVEDGLRVNDAGVEDPANVELGESDPESGSVSDSGSDIDNFGNSVFPGFNQNKLGDLYDSIVDCESIVDDLDREITLNHLNDKINNCIQNDCKKLSLVITNKRLEQKQYLNQKWNYDTYDNFNIDNQDGNNGYGTDSQKDPDYDDSLIEYKRVNLFPMVEKFTFLAGTDMYYWSGVIMRNSCRRNEFRGGVRQCGSLECGKWETYPREFLKCRRCKRTKYCSRECQMRAWHCHRNWCIPSTSSSANAGHSATNPTSAGSNAGTVDNEDGPNTANTNATDDIIIADTNATDNEMATNDDINGNDNDDDGITNQGIVN